MINDVTAPFPNSSKGDSNKANSDECFPDRLNNDHDSSEAGPSGSDKEKPAYFHYKKKYLKEYLDSNSSPSKAGTSGSGVSAAPLNHSVSAGTSGSNTTGFLARFHSIANSFTNPGAGPSGLSELSSWVAGTSGLSEAGPSGLIGSMRKKTSKHLCDFCGKDLKYASSLIIHQLKHTGEKPHQYETCDKTFAQTGTLKRHQKSQHKNDSKKPRLEEF